MSTRLLISCLVICTPMLALADEPPAKPEIPVKVEPKPDALKPVPAGPAPVEGAMAMILPDGSRVVRIATGHMFTEGPLWVSDEQSPSGGYLLFSDIPANKVFKWTTSAAGDYVESAAEPIIEDSGHSNGLTLDAEGRLLLAQHDGRVSYRDADGKLVVICDKHDGKGLNSPNDLCVRSDRAVFFTDPPYGVRGSGRTKELDFSGVYRIKQDGTTVLLNKAMSTPNGIAFSPDEKTLYVADTSKGKIHAFSFVEGDLLDEGRVFAELRFAEGERKGKSAGGDGVRVDVEGNVYCAGSGGVWVFDPTGKHLGVVAIPGNATNLCFGGKDRKTMFITGGKNVYAVKVKIAGCESPKKTRTW